MTKFGVSQNQLKAENNWWNVFSRKAVKNERLITIIRKEATVDERNKEEENN